MTDLHVVTTARSCSCVRHLRLLHLSTKSIWAKLRWKKAAGQKDGKCSLALRHVSYTNEAGAPGSEEVDLQWREIKLDFLVSWYIAALCKTKEDGFYERLIGPPCQASSSAVCFSSLCLLSRPPLRPGP